MFVKSRDLKKSEFFELLKSLKTEDFNFMIQTSAQSYEFTYFEKEKLQAEQIETLNLFSREGELKIRKLDLDLFRVVYFGESDFKPDWVNIAGEFVFSERKKVKIILWGESKEDQDFFVEQTIPHYFNYPVSKNNEKENQRVLLIQEVFYDEWGNVSFVRNYDLEVKNEVELCQ